MSKIIKIFVILLFFFIFISLGSPVVEATDNISITVVYNNVPYNSNLTTSWGMACVVKGIEKTILFDTGGEGKILLHNMEKLNISPEDIETVVLSHIHSDHVGGLWKFLEENRNVKIYLPDSSPINFKNKVVKNCIKLIEVKNSMKICKNVWSTGELGDEIKEQSLIIKTEKGLVIITVCAHPGIVNIVKKVKSVFDRKIYLVLGGFHLLSYNGKRVKKIITQLKQIGVEKVGPSHCTGNKAIKLFQKEWKRDFLNAGCGTEINIK